MIGLATERSWTYPILSLILPYISLGADPVGCAGAWLAWGDEDCGASPGRAERETYFARDHVSIGGLLVCGGVVAVGDADAVCGPCPFLGRDRLCADVGRRRDRQCLGHAGPTFWRLCAAGDFRLGSVWHLGGYLNWDLGGVQNDRI